MPENNENWLTVNFDLSKDNVPVPTAPTEAEKQQKAIKTGAIILVALVLIIIAIGYLKPKKKIA